MAKIARVSQKIFGSSAGANEIGIFGSFAAGSPTTTTSPTAVQSLAAYTGGWNDAILGSNAPAIEDVNALDFLNSYQLAYLLQQGVAEYDTGTTYFIGGIVNDGAGNLFVSIADSNANNPLSDVTKWKTFNSKPALSISTVQTANYTVLASDNVVRGDASGGVFNFTLPAASTVTGIPFTLIKIDSDMSMPITIVGTIDGGTNTTLNTQWERVTLVSNGTDYNLTSRTYPQTLVSYTPIIQNLGTFTRPIFTWRRNGSSIETFGRMVMTSNSAAATARIGLPPGLVITSLFSTGSSGDYVVCGNGAYITSTVQTLTILVGNADTSYEFGLTGGGSASGLVPQNGNALFGSGDQIAWSASIPIEGWK